jgi:hypothetical protein
MEIKKLTQKSCDILSENLSKNFDQISDLYRNHNSANIDLLCGELEKVKGHSFTIDDNLIINNQLNLKADEQGIYDFENAKTIYEMFNPPLTPFEANDERLWVRLTHDQGHKYMVKRWMNKKEKGQKVIQERFFFTGRSQSARIRNGISRLWWLAHLTLQPDEAIEENKWKYTKVVCESQDLITSLFERSIGSYENVRWGVLEFYLENEAHFENERSLKIKKMMRDLNNYGGVTLISLLTKDEVKTILDNLK